ncbi:sugar ABC transporter substrate-binding protein [Cryobacterium sp. PH31-AA6]|uniref:sugar ABC transporter substrate-binding protein n=1 Tax=Cryobacterium sp. PH31-AA6 TaxID=3046205 RepID=UPI0024BAF9C2|nr:sugar ABC transporter substrate-binding protein [Cryobacterium sp. PH31-AA6]MDJ0324635.1 sugar ABC transporter substrate-binding protein [Cryobacterium sp. PH31-AA6]
MRNSRIALVSVLAVAGLALSGCSATTGASDGTDAGYRVYALLPQGNDQPYGTNYLKAMNAAAADLGVSLTITNAEYDSAKQASECSVAIATKPDGIILWPAAVDTIRPCLEAAKAAGIPVNASNSDVLPADKALVGTYTGPSNDGVGRAAAKLVGDKLGADGGDIIIIQGLSGNSTAIDREAGFRDELAASYPNVKVIGQQPGDWAKDVALTVTSELLTSLGAENIDAIYAVDDTMAAGAIEAMENRGIDPTTIPVVGTGNTKLGQPNVLSGKQYATLFQSPVWDGENAVKYIVEAIKGNSLDANYFMPVPEVTKDNAADYPAEW